MSLYNMLFGYSPACIFALPILGHREDWYPRFRNAWMDKSSDGTREIGIYTRVGSLNHGCGFGEEKLYSEPGFLRFEDDDFDATYGTYVFKCPENGRETSTSCYPRTIRACRMNSARCSKNTGRRSARRSYLA